MIKRSNIMPDFCNRYAEIHYLTALNQLAAMDIDINRINIRAVGVYENYRGEIRGQKPEPGTNLTENTPITLEIGCSSAVDFMPYQFFYGIRGIRDTDRSWEENARNLLAPFDAAVIRNHSLNRFHALKYKFGVIDNEHLRRILELFDFELPDKTSEYSQVIYWISVLPQLYFWSGNPEVIGRILTRIFKYRFTIKENVRSTTEIPPELRYQVGSHTGRLGFETIIGREFTEFDTTYDVVVEDILPGDIKLLMPGGRTRLKIERLLKYCMPGDLDYRIRLKVLKPAMKTEEHVYLGYSSFM